MSYKVVKERRRGRRVKVARWVLGPEDYDAAMEAHLKAEREARGYTTREPDAYLASEVPRWRRDAEDWVAHRDAVMAYALGVQNAVAAGGAAPTLDEFKAGLPAVAWSYTEG